MKKVASCCPQINAGSSTGMERGSGCKDEAGFGWGEVVSSGLQESDIPEVSGWFVVGLMFEQCPRLRGRQLTQAHPALVQLHCRHVPWSLQ